MSLFLTIVTVLAVIILFLEVRRRIRKATGRLGRPRNAVPARGGAGSMSFDRQPLRSGGRKKSGRLSPLAGPVVVGLVFIFMGAWLAFSYFMPDAETTAAVLPVQTASPPAQTTTKVIGGRLTSGGQKDSAPTKSAVSSGAAAVLGTDKNQPPAPTFVSDAARSMIGTYSRMDQLGLLPSQAKLKKPTATAKASEPMPQTKTAQSKKGIQSKPAQPAAVASKPARPAETAAPDARTPQPTKVASSSLVGAASGATLENSKPAAPQAERDEPLLNGGRDYTVHLSSFREQVNAENYRSKLVAAGEQAYITETVVNGQHWYRVMSGRFKSRAGAETYARDLKRRELTVDTYMIKSAD